MAIQDGDDLMREARAEGSNTGGANDKANQGDRSNCKARSERCEGESTGREVSSQVGTKMIRHPARSLSEATAWLHPADRKDTGTDLGMCWGRSSCVLRSDLHHPADKYYSAKIEKTDDRIMGILKWYKRDPRAALHGMMGLSLEEKGAYNVILDLIYINDGSIQDDGKQICIWLDCDPRTWKRIRTRLIDTGKLYFYAGQLRNERADHETVQALRRVQVATEAADKRWADYNNIKGLGHAGAMLPTPTPTKLSFLSVVPTKK